MTNTELKALIDQEITDQTEAASISEGNQVGEPMKAIVDYVDQEVGIKPLIYKGRLSLDGDGFTFTPFENTIGNIVWSNPSPSNGQLVGTLSGAFPNNKTSVNSTVCSAATGYMTAYGWQYGDTSTVKYNIIKPDGSSDATPYFSNMEVEIKVYP